MITEQFSAAPQTKTRSLLILFVLNFFFFFFFGGKGSINSDSRGKIYSALKVLKELHFRDESTNSTKERRPRMKGLEEGREGVFRVFHYLHGQKRFVQDLP